MARVNLDGKIWKDPRVKRLAKRSGMSMRETVGTLCAIWDVAYDAKNDVMSPADVDTSAETDGFHEHLAANDVQLADVMPDGKLRLRGVQERIGYLMSQAVLGQLGGQKRAANAARGSGGKFAKGSPGGRLDGAKGSPGGALPATKGSPSLPLDLDLPPDIKDLDHPDTGRSSQTENPTHAHRARARVFSQDVAEALHALSTGAAGRMQLQPMSRAQHSAIHGVVEKLLREDGFGPEDFRRAGEVIAKWSDKIPPAGPGWLAKDGNLSNALAVTACATPESPGAGKSEHWLSISNLAAEEARLEAEGKPIPWLRDPRRRAMTHDATGRTLKPVDGGKEAA